MQHTFFKLFCSYVHLEMSVQIINEKNINIWHRHTAEAPLCLSCTSETNLTHFAAPSETEHELHPALNHQLRTRQETSHLTPTQLGSGRFYPLTPRERRRYLQCLLAHGTKPTSKVCFLTRCPLLPAGDGTWRSPFPGGS